MAGAGLLVFTWQLEVPQKIVFDIAKKALKNKVMKEVFIGQKILMKLSKVTLNTYLKVYL